MTFMDIKLPDAEMEQVVFSDVSWEEYEALLREIGDRPIYVTYDDGRMEMMAPRIDHERYKKILDRLIEVLIKEHGLDVEMLGSATFKREDLRKGLEPDECYYIANYAKMRGRWEIDLDNDPPPDLVVEVDITHHALDREAIYAAMGVPEIWRFNGKRLEALALVRGTYEPRDHSPTFPNVKIRDLLPFVKMVDEVGPIAARDAFQTWLKKQKH